jgi:hypothetical protein
MQFDSWDDAHHFFHFYAFLAGFGIAIAHTSRTTGKKKDKEIYKVEMRCHCYGKPEKKKKKGVKKEK